MAVLEHELLFFIADLLIRPRGTEAERQAAINRLHLIRDGERYDQGMGKINEADNGNISNGKKRQGI